MLMWLFLPAGVSNAIPALVAKVFPYFNYPLDFGRTLKGKRILGDHKTVRGFLLGPLFAQGVYLWQKSYLVDNLPSFSWMGGSSLSLYLNLPIGFGFLIGFGALFGDAIRSFFKRRIGLPPGEPWFPFDQIDWVLGASVFASFFIVFDPKVFAEIILLGLVTHVVMRALSYFLRIEKRCI